MKQFNLLQTNNTFNVVVVVL